MTWDAFVLVWLVRAAVGGFVVLAVAAVAVRCCRQPADRVRTIGLAVVGAVVLPWVAVVPGRPIWSVAILPSEGTNALATQQPETSVTPVLHTGRAPLAFSGSDVNLPPVGRTSEPSTGVPTMPTISPPCPREPERAITEVTPTMSHATWWTVGRVALSLYVAVTTGVVLWTVFGLARLARLRRTARPAPPEVAALLREIAGPGADRVRLLVSNRVVAPIAFAGWPPVIILPAAIDDRQGLRFALAHEWSHVERGDVWRWVLVAAAQTVLFYQPLFWWLRRHLRLSQDYLADARAAGPADAVDYAEYLVALARRRLAAPAFALGVTDRRSHLTWRVHMLLLNTVPPARHCRTAWTLAAALAVTGIVIGTAGVRLTAAPPTPPPGDTPPAVKKLADTSEGEVLHYTGRVTDKDADKPIAGAVVTVRRLLSGDPERLDRPIIEETRHSTDADGEYEFTIPPEQTAERYLYIELDVEHPDYAPKNRFGYALSMIRKNEKLGGRPFFDHVKLRPAEPVTGVVMLPDGEPAAGVKVMAYSVTDKRESGTFEYGSFADARTDAAGKFRLPLTTPGWAVVWLLPEDYVPETHVVKDRRGDMGALTLKSGPRLGGVVLDAKGQPLAGVIVNARSQDRNEEITQPVADQIGRSAVTDDRGQFELRPLPPGKYLVSPDDYPRDGSLDRKSIGPRPVPGVFTGTKVTIAAGAEPGPVEVRAVPHVNIQARHVDAAGKPTRGHAPYVLGKIDGRLWRTRAAVAPDGTVSVRVPHGLTEAHLDLMTNEHGALRWRKAEGEPLNNSRRVDLGTLNDDVEGIEIVRYTAPILIVKLTAKDGTKLTAPAVTAEYAPDKQRMKGGKFVVAGGRSSDVSFERQEDGRFRSEQLFPDEAVTVIGHADGFKSVPITVTLTEGTTKEIELVVEKASEANDE